GGGGAVGREEGGEGNGVSGPEVEEANPIRDDPAPEQREIEGVVAQLGAREVLGEAPGRGEPSHRGVDQRVDRVASIARLTHRRTPCEAKPPSDRARRDARAAAGGPGAPSARRAA